MRFDHLNEVSSIMNILVDECDKKIKSILSQYSREKKKTQDENKSGAGTSIKNHWFGYEHMQFLQDRNKPIHTRDTENNTVSIPSLV